ncbi:MAG: hypothetical protein CVV44_00435 [Spirochaetae bacterium HGW-Spirochaetae-1]|jgi:predicted Zn finger-like uncharacterized protein|nr:MAG: hypothetical protein CVV44_00435 [Spirochaetae bacterium HGW-Spirochaetae-1]
MIVRCSNCNSAFAVDDAKVENKRFAFTCPKCSNENIFDNRKGAPADEFAAISKNDTATVMKGKPATADFDFDAEPAPRMEAASMKTKEVHREEPVLDDEFSTDIPLDDISLEESKTAIDDMDLDIPDNLEDLDFDSGAGDSLAEKAPAQKAAADTDDLDLGDLELELSDSDISGFDAELASETTGKAAQKNDGMADLDLDLDLTLGEEGIEISADDLALDESLEDLTPVEEDILAEESLEEIMVDDEIITEEVYSRDAEDEDESITIDLDTLDIELEESDKDFIASEETPRDDTGSDEFDIDFDDSLQMDDEPKKSKRTAGRDDEDITLDLDSLDIDIQEEETISRGEIPDDGIDIDLPELSPELDDTTSSLSDDEDITLDLDSLDIPLEETEELKSGEIPDEDEKLTLEDAGLTMDELTADELASATSDIVEDMDADDDIRLTIDEIDPDLSIQELENELHEAEVILTDDDEELPEIDFDEYDTLQTKAAVRKPVRVSDEIVELDDTYGDNDEELSRKRYRDVVQGGSVNFSIDYSLKYSRLGAFLRLVQLFSIGLIPHFIVLFVYSILSMILGFINHIVVLSTKNSVEDFSEIIEKTLRYFLSTSTSYLGIVEEMPLFTGKKDIDYAMQLDIIYPVVYSRILAALRLSIIGIIIATLPHLVVLLVIGMTIPIFYLVGMIAVLITARWPHFLFSIISRYYRYMARVMAFMTGLVDKYPPFTF